MVVFFNFGDIFGGFIHILGIYRKTSSPVLFTVQTPMPCLRSITPRSSSRGSAGLGKTWDGLRMRSPYNRPCRPVMPTSAVADDRPTSSRIPRHPPLPRKRELACRRASMPVPVGTELSAAGAVVAWVKRIGRERDSHRRRTAGIIGVDGTPQASRSR